MPSLNVRVHILEARELKGVDSGGTCDPIVVVSCMGKKDQTDVYPKVSSPIFDKLMFFEYDNCTPEEIQRGNITIEVFDYNMLLNNILIGRYEFGVGRTNVKPGHEEYKKWVALFDPTKGMDPQGYLKVSCSVVKSGQSHSDHVDDDDDDDDEMVLMPPDLDFKIFSLSSAIFKAKDLPKVDTWGTCDGYINVNFNAITQRTPTVEDTLNPEWKIELRMPVPVPTMSDMIEIALYDEDMGAADDFIGSAFYSFKEIQMNEIVGAHWANLYGWPDHATAEDKKEVKARGEQPTDYKGSVLLSFETVLDEGCRIGHKSAFSPMDPEECTYLLRLDVFQVTDVPAVLANAKVHVTVGCGLPTSNNYRKCGSAVKLKGTFSDEWLDNRSGQVKYQMSWPKIKKSNVYMESQVPDIFVNLMCGTKRIGYNRYKFNMKTYKQLGQGQIKWWTLKPDKFDDLVADGVIPGFLQYRLQFGEKEKLPKQLMFPATSYQDYMLRAHIYQGKELPSADDNGMSDPFLEIRMGSAKKNTSMVPETLYPRWYETQEITVRLPTNHEMRPDIGVMVYDQDPWGVDFLGRFSVASKKIQPKFNPDPSWMDVMVGDEEDNCKEGMILCSFQLMKLSDVPRIKDKGDFGPDAPSGIAPEMFDAKFECLVIGVRNMEAFNLLDIGNPIVEMDSGERPQAGYARTESGSGPDASFLDMLVMDIKLPMKTIFAPNINVRIFDDRLLGEVNVGLTTIPVAPYMTWGDSGKTVPTKGVGAGNQKIAPKFEGQDSTDDEEEETQTQDYLPFTMELANEMEDEEFREFTFEKKVKNKSGGGNRTMKSVESQEPQMGDDGEQQAVAGDKKKPRQMIMSQWEDADDADGGWDFENPIPFDIFQIKRGQKKGGGFFGALLGVTPMEKIVGTLKVLARCYLESDKKGSSVEDAHKKEQRDMRMSVRLYVIQGINLMSQDDDGFSDPFLNVQLTNHSMIMDKSRTLRKHTLQPMFYVMYEFRDCTMPGDHTLTIEVWDEDLIGDDLIGKAHIDLENRWYCRKWWDKELDDLKKRPKELVPLWSNTSGVPQGRLEIWIDTLSEQDYFPAEKLQPPEGEPWELRVVCWDVDEVMFRDKWKIDMFASAFVEFKDVSNNEQVKVPREDTDTHWNIDAGDKGIFHWRWKMPVQVPAKDPRMLIQTWDVELLTPNDALAEANLSLAGLFKKAATGKMAQKLKKFNVNMTHPNYNGIQSVVSIEMEVLPIEEAQQMPATHGREGDAYLTDPPNKFLRPPGAFSNMLGKMNPFGNMKKYLIIACILLSIVGVLGIVMVVATGA